MKYNLSTANEEMVESIRDNRFIAYEMKKDHRLES